MDTHLVCSPSCFELHDIAHVFMFQCEVLCVDFHWMVLQYAHAIFRLSVRIPDAGLLRLQEVEKTFPPLEIGDCLVYLLHHLDFQRFCRASVFSKSTYIKILVASVKTYCCPSLTFLTKSRTSSPFE